MMQSVDRGVILTCDRSGMVLAVEKNNTSIPDDHFKGKLLPELAPPHERGMIMSLIAETHSSDASFGKTVHFDVENVKAKFFLSSVRLGEKMMVVASQTRTDFEAFLGEMMSINNEQTNELRRRIKLQYSPDPLKSLEVNNIDLQEFTRLNNELVNMQRELARKNKQLTHLNEEKNRFLGMAVHDLRNPLSVILSSAEIVLEEAGDISEEGRMFLERISELAGFMFAIVDDLLDFSVIESGRVTLKPEDVDLSRFITRTIGLQSAIAQRKNINILLKEETGGLHCFIDGRRMEQVLTNLLVNAIKFSFPGTVVTVTIKKVDESVLISVEDQGQGIPEAELKSLFQPFVKMSVKPTGGEKSTGLGLMIVKKIVESHSGTITCESTVGVGTRFTIRLPVQSTLPM